MSDPRKRFFMRGAQVNQEVLREVADLLNVPLHKSMRTAQMLGAIVNESFGRPDPQERDGIKFLLQVAKAYLDGTNMPDLSSINKSNIDHAIVWLERGGKRK